MYDDFVRFLMTNDYANFDLDLRKRTQLRSPTIFNQFIIKAHGQKRTTCKIETLSGKDLLTLAMSDKARNCIIASE